MSGLTPLCVTRWSAWRMLGLVLATHGVERSGGHIGNGRAIHWSQTSCVRRLTSNIANATFAQICRDLPVPLLPIFFAAPSFPAIALRLYNCHHIAATTPAMEAWIPPITFETNENPASEEERRQRLENPELGLTDTDHMAIAKYANGKWQTAAIVPFTVLTLHPASKCFQYGQTAFEGMQAFKTPDGKIVLFRPDENARRFNKSADRVAMPALPEMLFLNMVRALVWVERGWIPSGAGARLYIRPFMFATGNSVRFGVANEYIFCILVSPAKAFFKSCVLKVYVEPSLRRASPGGTGSAKCGGNYAAALQSHQEAERHGCDQALFLGADGKIQELEVTNIFFVMRDGTVRTPCLDDTVLKGITRASVITLAQKRAIEVEERNYTFKDFYSDAINGTVSEVFACGTAGGLVAIGSFYHPFDDAKASSEEQIGEFYVGDGKMGNLTKELRSELLEIQNGKREDPFGWRSEIRVQDLPKFS
jgi:branched-chain amino acid aminotransferase